MVACGMNYKDIAEKEVISEHTVATTIRNAKEAYNAANTAQCVVLAIAREELVLNHDGSCRVSDERLNL